MKIEAYGRIEGGVLTITGRKRFDADLAAVKDCDVKVTIERKGRRSLPQNRYYFGVVLTEIRAELLRLGQIGKEVSTEDLHHAFKVKFNPQRSVSEETGEVLLEVGGSTKVLNKEAFGLYLDKIILWSAESLGLHIPPPSTQATMFNDQSKAA